MGIPGLLSHAQQKMRFLRSTSLQNSHIYVDGLNFVSTLARDVSPNRKDGVLEEVCTALRKNLGILTNFEPKSITFYFDSFFPLDKQAIRAKRRLKNLRELSSYRQACHISVLAVKFLLKCNVKVVYTGLEAEDEIFKDINEKAATDRSTKHFVFSSDSDCFTFRMLNARQIEVVPIAKHKLRRSGCDAINLGAVQEARLVEKKYMRDVPTALEGRSTLAQRPMSSVLDFVNLARVHGEYTRNPPLIYSPTGICPHDAGIDIRRAAYGLIFRRWFNGETHKVLEVVQHGKNFRNWWIEPLEGQELDNAKQVLINYGIAEIVGNQFEALPPHYNISPQEIVALKTYVNDLIQNQKIMAAQTIKPRVGTLFPLLKAVLCAHLIWEEALGGVLAKDDLLWRISPHELSSYLR